MNDFKTLFYSIFMLFIYSGVCLNISALLCSILWKIDKCRHVYGFNAIIPDIIELDLI